MATNRFTGATNANWGTATNWSLGTVPTATDGHDTTFDGTSPNCTVNTSNRACNRITFVGYTNTITMAFTITVSGNVTLDSGMNVSGTGFLGIAATSTITSNGKTWPNNVRLSNSVTFTLIGDFTILGALGIASGSTVLNATTTEKLYCNGLGITGATQGCTGTAHIFITGGTWGSVSGGVGNNLTIQPSSSDVTVSSVSYLTGTLTYTASTYAVITTGSTLSITGSCTLNTNGITWSNISIASFTATINSLLSSTTITSTGSTTFAGTSGWTCSTFSHTGVSSFTVSFKESVTYTITSSLSAYFSRTGAIMLFTSSHASTRANLVMPNNGSNLCNVLASFTRIDASGGRSINTFGGTITDCLNINQYYDYKPVAI